MYAFVMFITIQLVSKQPSVSSVQYKNCFLSRPGELLLAWLDFNPNGAAIEVCEWIIDFINTLHGM